MKIVWQTVIKENYWRDLESERVKGLKSKYNKVNCRKNQKYSQSSPQEKYERQGRESKFSSQEGGGVSGMRGLMSVMFEKFDLKFCCHLIIS